MDQEMTNPTPRQRIIGAARRLFKDKGFHSTPIAELAAEASVSVGMIYRLFPGKDDIIVAICEENLQARITEIEEIFEAVERREYSVCDAVKSIASSTIAANDSGLEFEILAEAYRNPRVAERLKTLAAPYRDKVRRLASFARPDGSASELDAYADVMIACFFGLGHRTLWTPTVDIEQTSRQAACILMRALEAPAKWGAA
jgi:TetR/AcrR family transcriptional repressor of uid operon